MEKALVVVDSSEKTKALMTDAAELAAGVGAELVLLHVTSDSEYEQRRKEMERVAGSEIGAYDVDQASDGARQFAADLARELLADVDVEYEAMGAVGDRSDQVLRVAREEGCDHIFVAGRRRSPTGKALFGDTAQQVVLNFDGPVTIVTAEPEE